MIKWQLIGLVWLLFVHVSAQSTPYIDEQTLIELSRDNHWRTLIHYYSKTMDSAAVESHVDDLKYFFSPKGKTNSLAELKSTLNAFYLSPPEDINAHAICRMPARWHWLSSRLKLADVPVKLSSCVEYNRWYKMINPHSVTLVFASSYLNSPSSMFGHTFLRVDPPNVEDGTDWLSWAVNFGARVEKSDNSMFFAYRGMFGGYPGYFAVLQYYEKLKEYKKLENRDMWEYQLNLTVDETHRLVQHLWELRDIRFDYYFFDENCSYRLLELLEYARPGINLTSQFSVSAIPVDTVRVVIEANMISGFNYEPAATTQLQYQVDLLTPRERELARKIALGEETLLSTELMAWQPESRRDVYRVAYQYIRYMQLNESRDPVFVKRSMELLRAINSLPKEAIPQPPPSLRPDSGHTSQVMALNVGGTNGSLFGELKLRAAYHDLTDSLEGYLVGAGINIGELHLRLLESDKLQIEKLSFVEVLSHSPRNEFFKPLTWRVQGGFDQVYYEDEHALVPQVNGGAGVTYLMGGTFLGFVMLSSRLEYNHLLDDRLSLGIGPLAGLISYFSWGTLKIEGQYHGLTNGKDRSKLELTQQWNVSKDYAVRLNAKHSSQAGSSKDEIGLELRRYF